MIVHRKIIWGVLRLPYHSTPLLNIWGFQELCGCIWRWYLIYNDSGFAVMEGICHNIHP